MGQRKPDCDQRFRNAAATLGARAIGLAERDAVAFGVPDYSGLDDLGGEINQRTDHAARFDGCGDDPARIDPLQTAVRPIASATLKVPPRQAVLRADYDCVPARAPAAVEAQAGGGRAPSR